MHLVPRKKKSISGGGSESDNWALKATFEAYKVKETTSSTKIGHHNCTPGQYLEKERRVRSHILM